MAELPRTKGLWKYYGVTLQFTDRLFGGVPKSDELVEPWVKANMKARLNNLEVADPVVAGVSEQTATERAAAVLDTLPDAEAAIAEGTERIWTGFHTTEEGVCIGAYQVAAMLKEAAAVLRKRMEIFRFKSYVAERVFVTPHPWIVIAKEPDGYHESVKHLKDMFGNPVSALGRADYVEKPEVTFRLKVLDDNLPVKGKKPLTPDQYIPLLLEVSEELALGKDRAMQHGKFTVTDFTPEQ